MQAHEEVGTVGLQKRRVYTDVCSDIIYIPGIRVQRSPRNRKEESRKRVDVWRYHRRWCQGVWSGTL